MKRRVGRISGVVLSGGEPTLHPELFRLLAAVRALGYQVKLDTNGTRPAVLRRVLDARVVDDVAMDVKDVKDVPRRYHDWLSSADVAEPILESISLLRCSTVAHEFRTTVTFPHHDLESLDQIRCISGNESRWFLQSVNPTRSYVGHAQIPPSRDILDAIVQELRRHGATDLHWRGQERRSALAPSKCGKPDAARHHLRGLPPVRFLARQPGQD